MNATSAHSSPPAHLAPHLAAHLALEAVRFSHAAELAGGRLILDSADLAIARGAFVVLTGPSGAGKSTLLKLLCRLEEQQAGRVLLSGAPVAELPPAVLRRRVAYLHQTPTVVPGTVRENLLLPFSFAANAGLPAPADAALRELLARLNAADVPLDQEAATLSVGQRQRLCLARALLLEPEALLLDEPTSALDAESAAAVLEAAEQACLERGVTVLLVSHTEFTPRRVLPLRLTLREGRLAWT